MLNAKAWHAAYVCVYACKFHLQRVHRTATLRIKCVGSVSRVIACLSWLQVPSRRAKCVQPSTGRYPCAQPKYIAQPLLRHAVASVGAYFWWGAVLAVAQPKQPAQRSLRHAIACIGTIIGMVQCSCWQLPSRSTWRSCAAARYGVRGHPSMVLCLCWQQSRQSTRSSCCCGTTSAYVGT